jgi:uncharacterized protein
MATATTMATATSTNLPERLPLFPLPNVVLFPGMPVSLHVFETRYKEMAKSVIEAHKTLGMVLLKPGFEADYEGRPPIFETGCAGRIERWEELPDGRYNLWLAGLSRFRIREEHPGAPYRVASVEALPESAGDPAELERLRPRLLASIGRANDGPAVLVLQAELKPEALVNALCQSLSLAPIERQSLLDCGSGVERAHRLLEILEWQALESVMGRGQAATIH